MARSYPSLIVGIGGSAGALQAYKALLDAMSSNTNIALIIVSHMMPTASSELAHILAKCTKMPVRVTSTAMQIHADHVYVIPPNADLHIEGYAFRVVSPRTRGNAQIDILLTSLAEAMGARAVGVILSGYDGDGSKGCERIKAMGGATFAQDRSAEVREMPLHAQRAGCIDFVLPPDKIAVELARLARAAKL